MHSQCYGAIITLHIHNFSLLPNRNATPAERQLPVPRSPQPMGTTILLSVVMNVPTLGTAYKWNYIFVFLCLPYFKNFFIAFIGVTLVNYK